MTTFNERKWVLGWVKEFCLAIWRLSSYLKLFEIFAEHLLYPHFLFKRSYFSKLAQEGRKNTFVNGSCIWHGKLTVRWDLWKFSDSNQRCVITASANRDKLCRRKCISFIPKFTVQRKEINGRKGERLWEALHRSLSFPSSNRVLSVFWEFADCLKNVYQLAKNLSGSADCASQSVGYPGSETAQWRELPYWSQLWAVGPTWLPPFAIIYACCGRNIINGFLSESDLHRLKVAVFQEL